MGKVMLWTMFFLASFSANNAFACFAPPSEYTLDHNILVRNTSRIVLARVNGPSSEHQDYWGIKRPLAQFESVETIKAVTSSARITSVPHKACNPDITDISLNPNNGKFSPARINGADHASGNRISRVGFRYLSPVMPYM